MSVLSSRKFFIQSTMELATALDSEVRRAYGNAMLCCGQLVVEHDYIFGYLSESPLQNVETVAKLLHDFYHSHLMVFQSASEALSSFNEAFVKLIQVTGLETTGEQLAGYFFGGPMDRLLRSLRRALSNRNYSRDVAEELATHVAGTVQDLDVAMNMDSEDDLAAIRAVAEELKYGQHDSLEEVASKIRITSIRRDRRAIAFVALALAGWEPNLNCWEKNIAKLIRGENALRGQYRFHVQLDKRIRNDVLVGVSLDHRDIYTVLNGGTLLRVETVHLGQDWEGRYVQATESRNESMFGSLWAPYKRTPKLSWETMKDFVSQTGPVRYEWTSIINRMKSLGRACVPMDGMEMGKAFLSMTDNIKTGAFNLYNIWEKTMSQRSFTRLICGATTVSAARSAVIERMVLSTVTDGSSYCIDSAPIYLMARDGNAMLFDKEGKQVFVDGHNEFMKDEEVADVATKFFALLTRAMDGWVVKPMFYKDRTRRKSILRARGPRQGFDRKNKTEAENRATRIWRQLCESPFPT